MSWPDGWVQATAARLELPDGGVGWDPRPVLPLSADAPYDVDVVVVGGGPAGLSAAIRARWVKSFHAVPCSVAVFESGRLGGLSTWRTSALTGPGWRYLGDELLRQLWPDLLRLQVPVLPERVLRVERAGEGFVVTGEATTLRCRAVVLACGMRALCNEAWFLHHGLFLTYMGYGYFDRILERAAEVAAGRGLVVFGNDRSPHIAAVVARHAAACGGVTWIVDEDEVGAALGEALPGEVRRGRLVEVLGEGDRRAGFDDGSRDRLAPDWEEAAAAGVRGVRIETASGEETLACGAVLLDYNAWELRPSTPWDGLGLRRTAGGAVDVDVHLHSSVPGVFVAGDLGGDRYKSVAMALGDGVQAGFEAVRHVFRGKFGAEPNLYAYAATDRPLDPEERELPVLDDGLLPLLLSPAPVALARLPGAAALSAFRGARDLGDIAATTGVDPADLRALVQAMLERKLGTVHRRLTRPLGESP
ncbi:MAG: NAD(P)/FAD-dependent oxidoreductase [Alphaproteobacteria bacterium]|nr:NAD(P)/FAD-dependent oxidoreductase [Alphaproteobacteria bacterium]